MTPWTAFTQRRAAKVRRRCTNVSLPSQRKSRSRGTRIFPRRCLYILTEGILRVWLLDPQGNDVTDSFVWRPWQVASTAPRPETAGISETVTALVPSRVLVIPVEAARSLCAENPAFAREYLETIRAMYLALWEHKSVLMTLDAAARYRWFLERYPGMIDRVKHKLIASFLGMTPVSLSRIRGKLRDQGE